MSWKWESDKVIDGTVSGVYVCVRSQIHRVFNPARLRRLVESTSPDDNSARRREFDGSHVLYNDIVMCSGEAGPSKDLDQVPRTATRCEYVKVAICRAAWDGSITVHAFIVLVARYSPLG